MADSPIVLPKNAPPMLAHAVPPQPPGGFWATREGDDLVVQNGAILPEVCVKCGKRDGLQRRWQSFLWYPKWILWLLLVNVIVVSVVISVMQKRGRLALPLCPSCKSRWSMANLLMGLSVTWLIVGMITGLILIGNELPALGILTLLSSLAAPIGVGIGVTKPRTIRPKIIKDMLLTLKGVHPDAIDAIVAASRGQTGALPAPAGAISPPR